MTTLEGKLHLWFETGQEGCLWAFQDNKYISQDGWDLRGLTVLHSGDYLEILHENRVVWSGEIDLRLYPVHQESVFNQYIHADQKGIRREEWAKYFVAEYDARLTINEKRQQLLREALR